MLCPRCNRETKHPTVPRAFILCINCPLHNNLEILLMSEARDPLLEERQKTHGSFKDNAEISQQLKHIFHEHIVTNFGAVKVEALDMIALKLSRILSGQANFKDHWKDISGYSLLAMEACDEDTSVQK
jgi:hypothetical protein